MRKKLGRVSYSIFSVHHFSLGSWLFKFCLLKEQSPNFFFFFSPLSPHLYEITESSIASLHHTGCPLPSFLASHSVPLKAQKRLQGEKCSIHFWAYFNTFISLLSRFMATLVLNALGVFFAFVCMFIFCFILFIFPQLFLLYNKNTVQMKTIPV